MNLIDKTIKRLQEFEPPEGYHLADSGGKDSSVLREIAIRSGVKFDAHYQFTSVDPPLLVKFIKEHHPETEIHKPEMTMFQLIIKEKMLPMRQARFCCEILKERGGAGRFVLTGIRWEESKQRAERPMQEDAKPTKRMFQYCQDDKTKKFLHPLCDWTWNNIWTFIRKEHIPYCNLYDPPYNFKRIGCIGCPYAYYKQRQREFRFFPKFKKAYLHSIKKLRDQGKYGDFPDEEAVFDWWIGKERKSTYLGGLAQVCMFN